MCGVYWLTANASGILRFAAIAFFIDAACIVVTFAKSYVVQENVMQRPREPSGYLALTAEVNIAVYNVMRRKVERITQADKAGGAGSGEKNPRAIL